MSHKRIILGDACDEWGVWTEASKQEWTHISREEHDKEMGLLIEALQEALAGEEK